MGRAASPSAERLAAAFPIFVAVYFTAQIVLRLSLSSNLEPDEAEMAISPYWAMGYGNSQPPLYHWVVYAVQQAIGYWPLAMALVKNALLAASYLFLYDAGRRATGGRVNGALAAAGPLLLPQIVWESQVALSHSVLATASAAALVHALVLLLERRTLWRYVWLGAAIGAGLYAKYNFALLVGAVIIAIAITPRARRRMELKGLLVALAMAFTVLLPHLIWALGHFAQSTARLARMTRIGNFAWLDVPYLGLDGLINFSLDALAAGGPLLVIWLVIRRFSAPAPTQSDDDLPRLTRLILGRTLIAGLAAVALAVLAFDFHTMHIRYLTPLIVPLPLWLVLAAPQNLVGAKRFLLTAFTVAVLVTIAWPQTTLFGRHRFAYPYAELAAAMTTDAAPPFAVLGERPDFAENFVLRIPGATYFRPEDEPPHVLVVWIRDGVGERLIAEAGPAYTSEGPERSYTRPHYFWSGNVATIHTRLLTRR